MNKIRLLVAALLALTASSQAAITVTMKVTTDQDENGENTAACSLREAIKAVETRKPYGGCPAGEGINRNAIQLEPGNYQLTLGEISSNASVDIIGGDKQKDLRKDQIEPLTGKAPRRVRPDFISSDLAIGAIGTTITAAPNRRIFNTSGVMNLRDVVLEANGAVTGNGGIVYASGSLSLDNVVLRNGAANVDGSNPNVVASGNGGAIYLAGDGSGLTLTNVTIKSSSAQREGGAIAMLCAIDLSPYAVHSVTVSRSLFKDNASTTGAGAIQFCGEAQGTITATTFSANVSASLSGTLAYVQGTDADKGRLDLSYITAVEQTGHVLAFNGIEDVSLSSSLLARFDSANATELCFNPAGTAVPWRTSEAMTGAYNARDDDTCNSLLADAGSNILIPTGRRLDLELSATTTYPNGEAFSLTDYYLPASTSLYVRNRGAPLDRCTALDQRGITRKSGTACDIGAVERLEVTARDDNDRSVLETDRLAIIDVLDNDSFGESDDSSVGPYGFRANTSADPAVINVVSSNPALTTCEWRTAGQEHAGKLIVSTKDGALTDEDAPVTCTYQVVNSNGDVSPASATVKASIENISPVAENDTYIRKVGISSIMFDPLENDHDEGDGKYGLNPQPQLDTEGNVELDEDGNVIPQRDGSGNIVFTDDPDWAPLRPIAIVSPPQLGEVFGAGQGPCPGTEDSPTPETCFNPPLTYVADNNLSPFTDSFTYRVYDKDNGSSAAATVTIGTDAPDPDHGGGAGSMDLLGGLLLSLLGLRRLRRL